MPRMPSSAGLYAIFELVRAGRPPAALAVAVVAAVAVAEPFPLPDPSPGATAGSAGAVGAASAGLVTLPDGTGAGSAVSMSAMDGVFHDRRHGQGAHAAFRATLNNRRPTNRYTKWPPQSAGLPSNHPETG